jgi:hypothetical protein
MLVGQVRTHEVPQFMGSRAFLHYLRHSISCCLTALCHLKYLYTMLSGSKAPALALVGCAAELAGVTAAVQDHWCCRNQAAVADQ